MYQKRIQKSISLPKIEISSFSFRHKLTTFFYSLKCLGIHKNLLTITPRSISCFWRGGKMAKSFIDVVQDSPRTGLGMPPLKIKLFYSMLSTFILIQKLDLDEDFKRFQVPMVRSGNLQRFFR